VRFSQVFRVVLWMTGALLSFSAMAVVIRMLAAKLSIFEILAIRSGTGVTVLLLLAATRRELRAAISLRSFRLHLARNTIHFAAQYTWALAITLMPLATGFALEFTTPAYVAVLAAIFLGERLTASRIGVIVFGLLGVLVILRPGIESFRPASALMLAAAFGFALSLILTKKLTATQNSYAIIFWMNLIQLPYNLLGSDLHAFLRLDLQDLLPVVGLGVVGLSSHYCLASAFRSGDATLVVPLDFMRIPLIAFVGYWLYGERLDVFVFAGAGLIIAGIVWNLNAEAKAAGRAAPVPKTGSD
jgi:drug/metabolite transporter (DMT)-like permease